MLVKNIPDGLDCDCSLPSSQESNGWLLSANNYDELIDSPILVSRLHKSHFDIAGQHHRLVHCGDVRLWDLETACRDTVAIVKKVQEFWGEVPYEKYSFQNLILGGYGGLEHDNCCVLMTDPACMTDRNSYIEWLGLVCHEFFHTWNVRRLRPHGLQDYDYENEQYIRELWIAEGITSYFDDLLVYRAGLINESEYLSTLSKTIQTVMNAPGRHVQSLADSSFDTWIKFYRPDENSNNARVSYYSKGALVAWLLDIELARRSSFRVRLDDVMSLLWKRCRTSGYTQQDFEAIVQELVPGDWEDWFKKYIMSVEELEFQDVLELLGLRWKADDQTDCRAPSEIASTVPNSGSTPAKVAGVTLGCETKDSNGRLAVSRILRGGAASKSKLQVDDEVIALDGVKVTATNLNAILQRYRPGALIELLGFRRDRIFRCELQLESAAREWKLDVDSEASDAAQANRQRWLIGGKT